MNSSIVKLIEDNTELLQQLDAVLGVLDDTLYCKLDERVHDASIGGHVRHVLDHYSCLLTGLAQGVIEYDNRERKLEIEESRPVALKRLQRTIEQLQTIAGTAREGDTLQVNLLTCNGDTAQQPAAGASYCSSLARELAFLHSHTVHHNASIAVLLRLHGASELVPQDLGIAPATAQYQEQKKCAR
ncbi:MAG: hypothetical protein HKO71_08010 [Pseudomonadales bacterium]|nr:hypothetical protein [Gammaproteobacteria bacterium]NNL57683.1 hypothetical protein [Pseudomonadales bacterium]